MPRGRGSRGVPAEWGRQLAPAIDGAVLRQHSESGWCVEWREWGLGNGGSPFDFLQRLGDYSLTSDDVGRVCGYAKPDAMLAGSSCYFTRESMRALAVALDRVRPMPDVMIDCEQFCESWPLGPAPEFFAR